MKKQIIKTIVAFLLVLVPMAARATIGTTAGSGSICPATEADIPISVIDCNGVSAISLALSYDADKVTYLGYQNPSAHFGSNLHVNATGGVVYLTWYSLNAVDFGSGVLIEFRFEGINGTTALTWNNTDCEYSDANGNAIQATYTNGSVTVYDLPAITSQPNNVTITEGQNTTFAVTATGSGLSYQWQVSANGGMTWSNLSNSTLYSNVTTRQMNISNAPLTLDGNLYRCKVTGNCDPDAYSNTALLTVYDLLPTINTTAGTASSCPETTFNIPVSVTNCNNVGAISLALSYNSSLVTYTGYENVNTNLSSGMMEINEENGVVYFTWVASDLPLVIGGAVLFDLKFESQSGNSSFTWNMVDCEYSTPTGRVFPTSFTSGSATVYAVPSITSQPVNRSVDEGTNTTFGISATGHGLSYQWQVSTNGGEQWNNVSNGTHYNNATTATLTVVSATTDMDGYCYRCKVTGTCDPAAYSETGVLHVNPILPTIATQLASTTSCQNVEFGADVMVSNFNNVGSVSLALNYDTLLLTFEGYENLNAALADGSLYVNAAGGVVYISWMSVAGASIGNGRLLSLKFVGDPGSIALNWYTSRCEYANIQGLIFPATYQNGTATVYSAPYINSHPSNQTISEGSNTSFSVNAGGRALSYQWQVSENEGETWANLGAGTHYSNTTSSTLHVNNATIGMNGLYYRCVVSGECDPEVISNSAKLTVNHLLPTITTTAGSLTTCSSTEFSIPVTVTNFNGVGAVSLALAYNASILTYEGYEGVNPRLNNGDIHVNADGGVVYVTWMSVAGANIGNGTLLWIKFTGNVGSSSLNWDVSSCEYSNLSGEIFPATYTNGSVTIRQVNFTIDTQPEAQTILEGETATFSITTTGSGLSFQWQVSEDEGASWNNLTANEIYVNVNTRNLSINGATIGMNGNLYRCSVNGSCGMQYSHSALLTVGSLYEFYEVTAMVAPENAGYVTGAGTYYEGDTVTMVATANTGYHFVNWTENDSVVSTTATYVFYIHEDHVLTANFALNEYEITVSSNIGNAGDLSGAGTYLYGATCTLTATAYEGYTFVRWTLNGNQVTTDPSFSFTVTESRNYVAHFQQNQYEIMATALPEEGGTVTGAGAYAHGTTCTLEAIANLGYNFVNWTTGGIEMSTEASYSFTVTEAGVYVAHFEQTSVTREITASANPLEGGTVEGAGIYTEGATCTLTATANEGYTFVNWTRDGEAVSTEAVYSFTVIEDATFVANFSTDENHWSVDIYQYPYNMTVTGIVQIYGEEQRTTALEIGAFCGDECRGAQRLVYFPQSDYYLAFFTLYGDAGDVMSFRLYDHVLDEELDVTCLSTMSFVPDSSMGTAFEPYVFDFGDMIIEQVSNFSEGYNWWSTYIEQNGIDGLDMLQESLGTNGVTIRSQASGYTDYYAGYGWFGSLMSINNESSYRVITNAACSVTMTGNEAVPSEHPITLSQGWTWIGYVPSVAMDVDAAMSGVAAVSGDKLKSQQGYSDYYAGYGWFGSLTTIEPGMGLMYYSANGEPVTFTYPDSNRGGELRANLTSEDNHWVPNTYAYPDNMTVMAMVELDGVELTSDKYELAAFTANGECRGSVKLTYAEPLDRHVAFLTVSGKDAAELSFRLYDTETGMEYYDAEESLTFTANAIVGEATSLYVIHFRSTTGMDEFANNVKVYPNPVSCGEQFSIVMNTEHKSPVRVDIVNEMGVVVSVETLTQAPTSIKAPTTAGVYTLRISCEEGTCYRKMVVR